MSANATAFLGHALRVAGILILAGCAAPPAAPPEPIPVTPARDKPSSPVVREPIQPPAAAPGARGAPVPPTSIGPPLILRALPANALYVCVTEHGGEQQQTAIEFAPKVLALCRKHPEMGPCQYEREVCRRAGGRVFAANADEITRATESEYDKRVLRVRFRGD